MIQIVDHYFSTFHVLQFIIVKIKMVGKTGFEPATPTSRTWCSTKLSHFPIAKTQYGADERT